MPQNDNPYAPPTASVEDLPTAAATESAPSLWNPNAAASWSLIFGPLFGAILHMKNWQAMGDQTKAAQNKLWIKAVLAFYVVSLLMAFALPESKGLDAAQRALGFGLLIAWYYNVGKAQQAAVLARYGKSYPRRSWLQPFMWALFAVLGLTLTAIAIGFLSAS